MYPAGAPPQADDWTLETFLKAAEACHKAGHAFGVGLGVTSDSVDAVGTFFHSFGAMLVDKNGDLTVKSEPVRQAVAYMKQLAQVMQPYVLARAEHPHKQWEDQGNAAHN